MHRILIADDDPEVCALLGQVLGDAGYTVATAPDGHTALEHMAASLPDVLITDVLMPGLTGWSLFARVRRRALPSVVHWPASLLRLVAGDFAVRLAAIGAACVAGTVFSWIEQRW
jgi:CheY-like chemotaxis protein